MLLYTFLITTLLQQKQITKVLAFLQKNVFLNIINKPIDKGEQMYLMLDNYDSFVYNLLRYFEELGEEVKIIRNDAITIEQIEEMQLDGIIISPGPKSPSEAGVCLDVIKHFSGKLPILGICLGHQAIAQAFDASVVKGTSPIHGKVFDVTHTNKGMFKNIKNPVRVTRYHSLCVTPESLPSCLEVTAVTEDGIVMGIRHKEYLVEGVQFHPEAHLTELGHEMLKNFIEESKQFK